MSSAGKILEVRPKYVLPGGEIEVLCEDLHPGEARFDCLVDEQSCRITASSSKRVLAIVPASITAQSRAKVRLAVDPDILSTQYEIDVAGQLADGMHIVANPAVDPSDDAIVVTRSGSRGQHLDNTLYRIEPSGYIDELPDPVLNPTGIAFGPDGRMYVTNRSDGEVWMVNINGNNSIHASGLGIATGIAFDSDGTMYVGDRSGTVYRIKGYDDAQMFATLEPSVAAYHMAFGPDGKLYVSAPGLASSDAIYAIDKKGDAKVFCRGLGRPQGLAFDIDGNLYIAACYRGRHGIVRIAPNATSVEPFVSGNNIVGLCFSRGGDMIVATNETVYSLPVGIQGTLLQ
jgi:DNA-binding beta-propeller fold protein YncE